MHAIPHRRPRKSERWRPGRALGVAARVGLLLVLAAPADAQAPPAPEQLLAAALRADDLQKLKIAPGGWWNDAIEFNDRLDPDSPPQSLDVIVRHVFGKPDDNPAEVLTGLQVFQKAAVSADDFAASADADKREYGAILDGPKLGDQNRYFRQAADSGHEGGAAVHFQYGRYQVRIEASGAAGESSDDQLAALGRLVIGRLADLDAGKLALPPPSPLAKLLPQPDEEFKPVLGTGVLSSDAWAWIWSSQSSALAVSPRLRALLRDHVEAGGPVMRRYRLAASPSSVAELAVAAFGDADAAAQYLAEASREDSRRFAVANKAGDVLVSPPIADVSPAYRADVRVGRYVADISCLAPFAPAAAACEAAVKDLAARVKQSLPEK